MSDVRIGIWRGALLAVVASAGVWVLGLWSDLMHRPEAGQLVVRLGQWKPVLLKHGIAAGLLGLSMLVTVIGLTVVASRVLGEPERDIRS